MRWIWPMPSDLGTKAVYVLYHPYEMQAVRHLAFDEMRK